MTSQGSDLIKILHIPNVNLIIGEAMTRDDLIFPLGEQNTADLTRCLLLLDKLLLINIPEPNASIGRTSSSGYQIRLIWRPGKSLDGSLMSLLKNWNLSLRWVNKKFIVISSRGKVLHIGWPLETTDLLSMTRILLSVVTITIAASEIIEQNSVVSRASYEVVASQTDSPHSLYVSIKGPN